MLVKYFLSYTDSFICLVGVNIKLITIITNQRKWHFKSENISDYLEKLDIVDKNYQLLIF